MKRKYFYAQMMGKTEDAIDRIRRIVINGAMAPQIPLVKIEKNAGKQFYVFLGVDGDDKEGIPGKLGRVFRSANINFMEGAPLEPDDIKSMVQRQDIEIHDFNALEYAQRNIADPGDPFDQPDMWQPQEPSRDISQRYERLLHWVSARGEGTWASFAEACNVLGIADERQRARSALRRLNLLGHVDCSRDGLRWSAAPAAMVRFPDSPSNGFLSGQRTDSILNRLSQLWPLTETLHGQAPGPPRIELCLADDLNLVNTTGMNIVDAGVTSERLVNLSPDLENWKTLLPSIHLNPTAYRLDKWQDGEFHSCDTLFERGGVYYGDSGMYRLIQAGSSSGRTLTVFFDQPNQRWLRGDWYGLRFLAAVANQDGCRAVYDSSSSEIFIPFSQRWPMLYERVLTLASGLLPRQADNPEWLRYAHITLDIAQGLCRRLNVDLEER